MLPRRRLPLALALLVLLLAPAALAPAVAEDEGAVAEDEGASALDRRAWSTIEPGPWKLRKPIPQNFTASDGTDISFAIFMPADARGLRFPTLVTAGPYFGLLEEPVHVPSTSRLSGFLVENFVSHGYIVVAVSVRGTGWSGGCMEMMSAREVLDVSELIDKLAEHPFTDGNFALVGKSYDGTVPWAVAALGNPRVKTIVPIAGITSWADDLYRHHVPESYAAYIHAGTYWPFGFGVGGTSTNAGRAPENRAANAACPEVAESLAANAWSTATGDTEATPALTDYWRERDYRRGVIENYEGSVFVVHGLQDDVVHPLAVAPYFADLPQPKKMWLGQWGHHYPDEGAVTSRPDFARALKLWFDKWLKGMDVDTGPAVEVADATTRAWRAADAWPAPTGERVLGARADGALVEGDGGSVRATVATAYTTDRPLCDASTDSFRRLTGVERPDAARFDGRVASGFRLSGVGHVDVEVERATSGYVFAFLCVDGRLVVWGSGTHLQRTGAAGIDPYAPGLPTTIRVTLDPAEATIRAGADVRLEIRTDSPFGTLTGHGAVTVTRATAHLPTA